ncbi:Suppressor of activated egl-4 protein [Dirofilaria immitis]
MLYLIFEYKTIIFKFLFIFIFIRVDMFGNFGTGNGNGNKLNLRTEILEGLLASMGEGKNAKVNLLKQTIMRNKTDMAGDAFRSLDLMRQVFQSEMTDEFRQIIERHLRTTFSPALENLQRNGLEVTDDDIKCLCRSILEAAKKPFLCEKQMENFTEKGLESPNFPVNTESDLDSETSVVNFVAHQRPTTIPPRGRKRGRPPKTDNPGRSTTPSYIHVGELITELDLNKWNPDRVCSSSQFILTSKVSRILMLHNYRELFMKYPTIFRYNSDEMDRKWLIKNRFTNRLSGEIYLLLLNDAAEIANAEGLSYLVDVLKCFAFRVPPSMILKMKQEMRIVSDTAKNN